jgi:hypothetical protein
MYVPMRPLLASIRRDIAADGRPSAAALATLAAAGVELRPTPASGGGWQYRHLHRTRRGARRWRAL